MLFKIKNIKFSISFTFFALILILIYFNKTEFLFSTLMFALAHEAGHLLALFFLQINVEEIKISIFGGNIKISNTNKIKYSESAFISFCGPFANIILFLLFFILSLSKSNKNYEDFFVINLVLALFNLLPFYNFDGEKILSSILNIFLDEATVNKIITVTSIFLIIPFSCVSIYFFLLDYKNFYLLTATVIMLLTIIFKK